MARYFFADTETTGVKPTDKICEVAYKQVDIDFNVIAEGASLINPLMEIHYAASAVNGITNAMVADQPTIDQYMVAAGFPLMGDDVVLICHNAAFDHRYLAPYMSDAAGTICTLKCARVLYPDAENHKQGTLAAMLGIEVAREKAHSADGDLDVLIQLTKRMCLDAQCTLADLCVIQNTPRTITPRTITKMPFGKHRGTLLAELPREYISWLLHKCENLDADLRASLVAL